MAIKLNSPNQIPQGIACVLRRLDSVFAQYEFSEELLENADLHQIAAELDGLSFKEGVIGYHYTRAVREEIEAGGLQVSRGADRRSHFISRYGHLFSEAQRQRMHQAWEAYFDSSQTRARDNRIWFNFTLDGLDKGGADRLLTYFGGEVVYMPLTKDEEIAAVLRTIGQPLILECAIATEKLHTFPQIPWGRIWLSTYHVSINRNAHQLDVDAYSADPVSATQLVSIRVASPRGGGSWSAINEGL